MCLCIPLPQPSTPLPACQMPEHAEWGKDVRVRDWKAAAIERAAAIEMLKASQLITAKPVVHLVRDVVRCDAWGE